MEKSFDKREEYGATVGEKGIWKCNGKVVRGGKKGHRKYEGGEG